MDDRSNGKETRSFTPFLDLLDLHDLIQVQETDGVVGRSALPGRPAPAPAAPAAADEEAVQFSAKLGPLPSAPPAPELEAGGAAPGLPKADPVEAPQVLSLQVSGAMPVHGAATAKAAVGGGAAQGAKAGKEPAQPAEDDLGREVDIDGVRVRIEQDADIEQEAETDIEIRADGADAAVRLDAEVEVDQDAAIVVRAAFEPAAARMAGPLEDVAIVGRQAVDIRTDIRVDVTGYAGEVVVTTALSEEADVDQDIRAAFRADADDGVFDIDLSQFLDIELLSDLEIDIRAVGGRLYIDLSLRDAAEGEDVMRIDVTESADDLLDIDLRQAVDIGQRISIDLDVEQELARLFDIDVDVEAEVEVVVRQSADVEGALELDGSADWEVDGGSQIDIENQLRIRIDFGPA